MNNLNSISNPPKNFEVATEGLVSFIKSIVKESMEEVINDRMYENVVLDQKLTTKQLCERWNISKSTLHAWEDKGIISPIRTGGRKRFIL